MTIEIEPQPTSKETASPGQILKKLREKFGLSQWETSRLAGISQPYLSQIENDEVKDWGLGTALRLSQTFGQGILFLEGGQNQKVFLLLISRKLHQFLLTENDPDKIAYLEQTLDFVSQKYPQVGKNNLIYIDLVDQKTLAERFRSFRGKISQGELGVGQATVSFLEAGITKKPKISTIRIIADNLGISIEKLTGLQEILVDPKVRKFDQILRDGNIPLAKRKSAKGQIENTLELLEST